MKRKAYMMKRLSILTLLVVGFLVESTISVSAADPVDEALDYANRRPSERERSLAVEKLLQAATVSKNPNDKATIFRRIARMYWQNFDRSTEKQDLPAAISYCEKALAILPDKNSLLAAEVQLDQAGVFMQAGKFKEADALCTEIIERSEDEILKGEISPEVDAKLRRPKAREEAAVARSPELGNAYYEDRLNRYKQGKAMDYLQIQESAVQILANTRYRLGGLPALVQLEKEMKSESLREIVGKMIAEKTKTL